MSRPNLFLTVLLCLPVLAFGQMDPAAMSPQQILQQTESMLQDMRGALREVSDLLTDARSSKDIVQLNCVNEKVIQIKGLLRLSEQSSIRIADSKNLDRQSLNHEFTKIIVAHQKVTTLLEEAKQCVGESNIYTGDTEIRVDIDEDIRDQKEKEEGHISGRAYEDDQKSWLKYTPIRIVHMETGKAYDTETNKQGCYEFENIPFGTYSMSLQYQNLQYLLAQKILVEKVSDKKVVVIVCVAIDKNKKESLLLLEKCKSCKVFPLWYILTGAGIAGALIPGEDEEVSPSRP